MKIDKEFTLGDSSVNCYGFRLLTSGYQMPEYAKNPIGYYMHQRDSGVVVKWEDLQIKGDRIVGKPVINMSNPRGQQTVDEINNQFLNAASLGSFVVLEYSDDEKLKLPGQTGVTVTKWYNRECSLVDVPGNFNAISLQDKDGNAITLSDLKAGVKLNVDDSDFEAQIDNALKEKDITELEAKSLKKLTDHPDFFAKALKMFKEQRLTYLRSMTWDGLESNGLLDELKKKDLEAYKEKYAAKYHKPYTENNSAQTLQSGGAVTLAYLQSLSWDDLDRKGLTEQLIAQDVESFNAKFKAKFGRDYAGHLFASTNSNNQPAKESPRLTYLKSLEWDELDRKALLQELKERSLEAFEDKFKAHFGVDYKPAKNSVVDKTKQMQADKEHAAKRLSYLQSLSWDELDKNGVLAELKQMDLVSYNAKFKAQFGRLPKL